MSKTTDDQIRTLARSIARDIYDINSGNAYERAGRILNANKDQVDRIARTDSDWPQGRRPR